MMDKKVNELMDIIIFRFNPRIEVQKAQKNRTYA